MKVFLQLMGLLTIVSAGLTLVAGSLNALFGWNLGLRIGGSAIPLPDDFVGVVTCALLLLVIGGLFYAIADVKRLWRFVRRYYWQVFGTIVALTAVLVIGLPQAFPHVFLEIAVQEGQSSQAQALLDKRDYSSKLLSSLTYWSLKNGDLPLTEKLLAKGADLNHRREDSQGTLLHSAVQFFPTSAVDFLLDKQVDLNANNKHGNTALHNLILYRSSSRPETTEAEVLALTKQLVEAGADPTITNNGQQTPLDQAASRKYETVIQYLQKR